MEKIMTIYHGSAQIIEKPSFGKGKKNNDFGFGFYVDFHKRKSGAGGLKPPPGA